MMKKYLFILLLLVGVTPCYTLLAQELQTMHRLGHTAVQSKEVIVGTDTTYYTFGGGEIVGSQNIAINGNPFMLGFAGNVDYFPTVFGKVFASKGYYGDYVQLRWDILSAADLIKRFNIYRKNLDSTGDSVLVAVLNGDEREWRDESAPLGQIQEYTIYAEGLTEVELPGTNII